MNGDIEIVSGREHGSFTYRWPRSAAGIVDPDRPGAFLKHGAVAIEVERRCQRFVGSREDAPRVSEGARRVARSDARPSSKTVPETLR
jgi:hypothetical protein